MRKKIYLWTIATALLIGALFLFSLLLPTEVSETPLLFSNTQEWDTNLYTTANEALYFKDVGDALEIPPPPSNTSEETRQEIAMLKMLSVLRNEKQMEVILQERDLPNAYFGSSTLSEILSTKPHTNELVDFLLEISGPVILSTKQHFDRVRPSYLDPTLTVAIEIPNHPAYPSGHAAQSKLMSLVLSALDPAHEEIYRNAAARIAEDREIAGVHYPSDSAGGALLAEKMFTLLQDDNTYIELFTKAQEEW